MIKAIKKALSVMLVVVIMLTAAPLSGFVGLELPEWLDLSINASAESYSGTCGENLTWEFDDSTGTLTISGTGAMYDSYFDNEDSIKKIIINDGVTSIGVEGFAECVNLSTVILPDSVTSIGIGAFALCSNLANVTIPSSVTSIDQVAFAYCESLTDISIPDSVTTIGDYAFAYCTSLKSAKIPQCVLDKTCENIFMECGELTEIVISDSVTTISKFAFQNCMKLTTIIIPDTIISIEEYAFALCINLTDITIPDSVTTIGEGAFALCINFTDITIPDAVDTIGEFAFAGCIGLTGINVDASNSTFSNDEYGVLFNKEKTELIQYPIGNEMTHYDIPDGVTTIKDYAFFHGVDSGEIISFVKLSSITIPDSVTIIGVGAFAMCEELEKINIPCNVSCIGEMAFGFCSALTEITVDNENKYFSSDDGVLFNKDKTELVQYPLGNERSNYTVPDTVVTIGDGAFDYCNNLTSVIVSDNVTTIGDYAFEHCANLKNIIIGDGVNSIGHSVFYDCPQIETIYLGKNLTNFSFNNVFPHCYSIVSITVDDENQSYSNDEFGVLFNKDKTILLKYPSGNSRTSYIIPEGVTKIENGAFIKSENITDITIPASVTTINYNAFSECNNLSNVYYLDTIMQWNKIKISNGNENLTNANLYYENVTGVCGDNLTWEFDYYTGTLTISGTGAMYGYKEDTKPWYSISDNIEKIIINEGVTTIGEYAFTSCTALTSITIPDTVTTIGSGAFISCSNLKDVTIPDSVTTIGNAAFFCCESLMSIMVDSENQYYSCDEYGVLFNKDKTILIRYPCGNTSISYIIPDTVKIISDDAFSDCKNLRSVIIGDGVTTIGKEAFIKCYSLTSITIPDSVSVIGLYAFNPKNITDIYYSGTKDEWNKIEIDKGNQGLLNAKIHFSHIHNYTSTITPPSCTEKGYTTYMCEYGDSYVGDYISATGHTNDILLEKLPTCIEPGLSEGTKCSTCGEIIKAQSIIPATGHYFDEWVVIIEPTITKDGLEGRYCTVCGEEETRTIPSLCIVGDVNNDGKITAVDARMILQITAGLREYDNEYFDIADVNGDGKISSIDARIVLMIVSGLLSV